VPFFISRIARATFFCAFGPYFGMNVGYVVDTEY
jgi:hypothetical protein